MLLVIYIYKKTSSVKVFLLLLPRFTQTRFLMCQIVRILFSHWALTQSSVSFTASAENAGVLFFLQQKLKKLCKNDRQSQQQIRFHLLCFARAEISAWKSCRRSRKNSSKLMTNFSGPLPRMNLSSEWLVFLQQDRSLVVTVFKPFSYSWMCSCRERSNISLECFTNIRTIQSQLSDSYSFWFNIVNKLCVARFHCRYQLQLTIIDNPFFIIDISLEIKTIVFFWFFFKKCCDCVSVK